jgi:hypothetical protein
VGVHVPQRIPDHDAVVFAAENELGARAVVSLTITVAEGDEIEIHLARVLGWERSYL